MRKKTYRVRFAETCSYDVSVQAGSEKEAMQLIHDGDYDADAAMFKDTIDRMAVEAEEEGSNL